MHLRQQSPGGLFGVTQAGAKVLDGDDRVGRGVLHLPFLEGGKERSGAVAIEPFVPHAGIPRDADDGREFIGRVERSSQRLEQLRPAVFGQRDAFRIEGEPARLLKSSRDCGSEC